MNRYEKEGLMGARMQAPMGDRTVVTELSEEFSLPDYQPEMKRLLRVRATVLPADQYIGAGNAECAGRIDYSILYTGNDGALYCTSQSGEYQFSVPLEIPSDFEASEGIVCNVESLPEQTSGRVVAPRKLAVKCKLRSRVRLYGTRMLSDAMECDSSMERLCGESEYAAVFFGKSDVLQLADEILLDDRDGNLRVISADGQVFISEANAGSGAVHCKGEVCLKLLCCRDDGVEQSTPYAVMRRIPLSESVTAEGTEVNCEACAHGVCSDVQITVEDGRILCEVGIQLAVKAMRRERIAYTRDLYSTERMCENAYRSVEFPSMIKCCNGNVSLNTTLTLEEAGIRSGLELVDLCGSAVLGAPEQEKGKYRFVGKCRFHAVLSDGEELSAQEFEVPFRYEIEDGRMLPTDYETAVDVITCRGKIDGERIGVDAELAIAMSLCGKDELKLLSEATFGEPHKHEGAVYTVCYPDRADTLWSVAKRYHCAISQLSERNHLAAAPAADAADSLAGVRFLLI